MPYMPCPYCGTEVVFVDDAGERYVNGIKPSNEEDAGCEFCKPTFIEVPPKEQWS